MRNNYSFVKLSVALVIAALLLVGTGLSFNANASPLLQATATTTPSAGGVGGMMQFPPCPSTGAAGTSTPAATTASANATTISPTLGGATLAATSSASTGPVASGAGQHGFLGIQIEVVENCGVRVVQNLPGGPAEMAQLMVGDVIVAVNCIPLTGLGTAVMTDNSTDMSKGCSTTTTGSATMAANGTPNAAGISGSVGGLGEMFTNVIQAQQPGQSIVLTIERKGQQMNISVTLGTAPSALGTASAVPSK